MDVERIIDDIEQLQEMFEAPDIRPLSASDISAVLLLCTGNGHIQVHRDERRLPSPQLVFTRPNAVKNEVSLFVALCFANHSPAEFTSFTCAQSRKHHEDQESCQRLAPYRETPTDARKKT
jgi:hypothetical protein